MGTVREYKKKNKAQRNDREKQCGILIEKPESDPCVFDKRQMKNIRDEWDGSCGKLTQRDRFRNLIRADYQPYQAVKKYQRRRGCFSSSSCA